MSWGLDLLFSTKLVGLRLSSAGFDPVSSKVLQELSVFNPKPCRTLCTKSLEKPIPVSVGWGGRKR